MAALKGDKSGCRYRAVGESHYQDALSSICGGKSEEGANFKCRAQIIPEPDNPYDRQAVRVVIKGQTVGYLPAHDCAEFLGTLSAASAESGECDAIIDGGWLRDDGDEGSFGVKLNITLPFSIVRASVRSNDQPRQVVETSYLSIGGSLVVLLAGAIMFGYAMWSFFSRK